MDMRHEPGVGPAPTVEVAIVVVTFNSAEDLPGFFDSLETGLDGVASWRIAVSDNASADDSVAIARSRCPSAVIVESDQNRGYAAAVNAGAAAVAPFDHVLVVNDDTRLGPGSVRRLVDALASGSNVGVAVPRLVDGSGQLLTSLRREPTIMRAFGEALLGGDRAGWYPSLGGVVQDAAAYEQPADVEWASGCAWLISGECWERVGTWDESLFLYSEDVDYALRVRDAGLAVRYVPEAEVVHLVGPSHENPRLWSMVMWNRYRLYRRRHGPFRSTMFRLGLLTNEVLRAIRGRQVHKAGALALISRRHRPEEVRGA